MTGPASGRFFLAEVSFLAAVAACHVLGSPSRIRAGELYVAGSAKYDAYFGEVHARQVAVAAWPAERKSARKPLVDALKITTEPDDATLVQMTKDRLGGGALRLEVQGTEAHVVSSSTARGDSPRDLIAGVEQTAEAETARSKRLADLPAQLNELINAGHALEPHLGEDFIGEGQKPFEVREELNVSYDVLQAIAESAKREQEVADQLVAQLGRAVSTASDSPAGPPSPSKGKPSAPARPSKSDEPVKPPKSTRPAPRPEAASPSPKPSPPAAKPAEHTEVFSP